MPQVLALAAACALSGCATSTIDTAPDQFKEHRSAKIPQAAIEQFVACVTTGFDESHWALSDVTTRQTRRPGATRIEALVGGRLPAVIVTVQDAGDVTLHEADNAALINTRGEYAAFDDCLGRATTP